MKPTIVHLSNDYPDPLKPDKTQAIRNIVEATPQYRHVVYSLNRVNGFSGLATIPFGKDRTAISYGALPKGLLWKKRMEELAVWIMDDLERKDITPNLIQAHKITVEGLAGYVLAEKYGCPLVCDIQGGTDVRILKAKKAYHAHYRKIVQRSSCIFPYAPWVIPVFEQYTGLTKEQCTCLPVLPGFDDLRPSDSRGTNKLVTLMRFDDRANKNLTGTMHALRTLSSKHPNLTLDVYGGGDPAGLTELVAHTKKLGRSEQIQFKGPIDNTLLPQTLGQYTALVTPSFMETYGLVYAESLFCGLPVIYSKGRAIDGYFDPGKIGYACDPVSTNDIAAAIDHVVMNENTLKTSIATMQQQGELDLIRRSFIIESYCNQINRVLNVS